MMLRRLTTWCVSSALLLAGCTAVLPGKIHPPVRVVRVKLVADSVLRRAEPRWRDTARDLLRAASDYYEERFGIRLAHQATEAWRMEGTTSSSVTLMRWLKRSYPRAGGDTPHDVVIGLTRQPLNFYKGGRARADRFGNCTQGLGNYIVSHVGESFDYDEGELTHDAVAIIHEMGHLLGAVHTDDPESVMHRDFELRIGFDAPNRAIVMANRLCPFARPHRTSRLSEYSRGQ
ncbi:MAG: M12 family metallo-peptidase [Deltaproteobacteria bacterium]|nr:M12 family metallo-peptidase [Deltaproteobacteria bacterium]